ncbi:MAG: nucleoside deaminase [Bacteroidales bacterium]|jgi:tRNA(Arg) A34 adenosine deaminase TadA
MENDTKHMLEAITLASVNAVSSTGGPFGAVVVKDGEVVSSAVNTVTTDNDPTAHAEVNAIRLACKKLGTFNLTGCTLYSSCEPCPMCLSAAYWAHIDKIFYAADRNQAESAGFSDAFIYDQFALPIEERSIPFKQIFDKEGIEPFSLWIDNENKIKY